MVPGDILITEVPHEDGSRIGTVKFKTRDGKTVFEKDWSLAAPSKSK
jgi:hypothetical protein